MARHEQIQECPITAGQVKRLCSMQSDFLPTDQIPFGLAKILTDQPSLLKSRLSKMYAEMRIEFEGENKKATTLNSNILTIDYSLSLEKMIDAGNYDWKNSDITSANFPISGKGIHELEFELIHFGKVISTADAEKEIAARGFKPAKIEHLLAFGAKLPEEQRKYPIIGLGTAYVLSGNRDCPSLSQSDRQRVLRLSWRGHDWRDYCRFLAVRKSA